LCCNKHEVSIPFTRSIEQQRLPNHRGKFAHWLHRLFKYHAVEYAKVGLATPQNAIEANNKSLGFQLPAFGLKIMARGEEHSWQ
jgi:hypothetical protein